MSVNLGRVAFVARGAYDAAAVYKKHDYVTMNHGSYAYIHEMAEAGKPVTDTAYWQPLVDPSSMNEATLAASSAAQAANAASESAVTAAENGNAAAEKANTAADAANEAWMNIQSDLDNKMEKDYFEAENIPFDQEGYIDSGDGTITATASARCTDFIDIQKAKEINYKTRISSSGANIAFYDAEKTYLKEISVAGTNLWEEDTIYLVEQAYQQAAYARVSVYGPDNIPYVSCILYRGYNLDRMLTDVDGLKEKSQQFEENLRKKITPDDTTFFESHERFDKGNAAILLNRFADAEGYVGSGANTVSVVFPVQPLTDYVLQINPEKTSRNRGLIVGNTAKDFPNGTYELLKRDHEAQNNALAFTTGATTTWAFAYIESGTTAYTLDDFSLQANGIPVDTPATFKKENLPEDIAFHGYASRPEGVNVLIFGDSISDSVNMVTDTSSNRTVSYAVRSNKDNGYTDGEGNTIRFYMWPTLMQQLVKCREVRNYALSGASYKDRERTEGNERQNVSYQVEVALNDLSNPNGVFAVSDFTPDIVIFALGTNDGAPNDTFEAAMEKTVFRSDGVSVDAEATLSSLDRTKFCEAARYALLKIRKAFPDALGLCVLPIQRAGNEIPGGQARTALRDLAHRCGYIPLDGYGEMGIVRDLETVDGLGACLKDGLHPNDVGQKMYARMIVQAIRNHFLPLSEFAD